jgi:hypothetical protein
MVSVGRAVSGGHGDLQGAGALGPRPITAVLSPPPLYPSYAHYVGGDWYETKDVQELAYALRVNAELAHLAYLGLRAYEAEVGTPDDDVYSMVGSLIHGVSNGAFALAAELEGGQEDPPAPAEAGVTDLKTARELRLAKTKDGA